MPAASASVASNFATVASERYAAPALRAGPLIVDRALDLAEETLAPDFFNCLLPSRFRKAVSALPWLTLLRDFRVAMMLILFLIRRLRGG
jgi:hypothetical protein